MVIQCDKCGAKFQLADDKVSDKGTKVRCSKCKAVFTVKKPKEQASTSAPPPPSSDAPARKEGGGDDPFSDFNFSDDLDFGQQDESIDMGQEADSPPSPQEPAVSQEEPSPPDQDMGFDFPGDTDFSLSEETDEEPGPPAETEDFGNVDFAEPAPEPEPPPAPDPADSGAADSGAADFEEDFSFDEESFAEGQEETAPGPPPAAPQSDEWGNVSLSDGPDEAPAGGAETDFEDAGFGDFQFDQDDSLPSSGPDEEDIGADDFVRSPTSGAPVRDSLEASIDESEPEPAPAREERREAPSPPPKPVIKREVPTSGKSPIKWVLVAAFLPFVLLLGMVAYTNSHGWFTFSDLVPPRFDKIGPAYEQLAYHMGWMERPDYGAVEVVEDSIKHKTVQNQDGQNILAVSGQVINSTRKSQYAIRVELDLTLVRQTEEGVYEDVVTGTSYCDVSFTKEELRTMSMQSIQDAVTTSGGRNQGCLEVPSGDRRDFTVVFFLAPDVTKVKPANPRVVEYKVLGE